ncbi:hypothetical protein I6F11_26110 [Ensifer sp. NBAIM29]|nr:hypothetical protein [Ensifer sp. NBAIM29]
MVARDLIQQGIKAHEFPQQDSALAADCFRAATMILHHPRRCKRQRPLCGR